MIFGKALRNGFLIPSSNFFRMIKCKDKYDIKKVDIKYHGNIAKCKKNIHKFNTT